MDWKKTNENTDASELLVIGSCIHVYIYICKELYSEAYDSEYKTIRNQIIKTSHLNERDRLYTRPQHEQLIIV